MRPRSSYTFLLKPMQLSGKYDTYAFDPGKSADVLRAKGKFGTSYLARNSKGQRVVVKMLAPALKRDENAVRRFLGELRVPSDHPGLVKCIEAFRSGEDLYLVREYAEGRPLHENRTDVKGLIAIASKVLDALDYLHRQGVVHRDIRPQNVIVNGETVKLIDLGLAKIESEENERTPFSLIYSPPEQVLNCGEAVNATSDIYSLALTLYECMTGKQPFAHEHPEMLMHLMINQPLKPDKKIPQSLFSVLQKAAARHHFVKPPNKYPRGELVRLLRKGQNERYSTAADFKKALHGLDLREEKTGLWTRLFGK